MLQPRTRGEWHRRTATVMFSTVFCGPDNLFVADFLHPEDAEFAMQAAQHFGPALRALRDLAVAVPADDPRVIEARRILEATSTFFFPNDRVRVYHAAGEGHDAAAEEGHYTATVIRLGSNGVRVRADDDGRIYLADRADVELLPFDRAGQCQPPELVNAAHQDDEDEPPGSDRTPQAAAQ